MHLIYFVNSVASAKYIDSLHNDIFFTVDQETIGKSSRQPSFCRIGSPAPTLFSELRSLIKNNLLGLRINSAENLSISEIHYINSSAPDFIILPMIKNLSSLEYVRQCLNDSIQIIPLIETCSSLIDLYRILKLPYIHRVHLGLNDLSIELDLDFMFDFLSSPAFSFYTELCCRYNISFGFGGVSAPLSDSSALLHPSEIIRHHVAVNSDCTIISRNLEKLNPHALSDNIYEIRRLYSNK